MFGLPIGSALTLANVLYLISLLLTFILSVTLWRASVLYQLSSDEELEKYKAHAAAEVAQAGADAARANERAAVAGQAAEEARKEAAQALRDAAQANLAAEQERLARASLEARIVARRLTSNQSTRLTVALMAINSQVPVLRIITIADQEAAAYGEDIVTAIAASGIRIDHARMGMIVPPLSGVFLSTDVNSALGKAFIAAGIPIIALPPGSPPPDASVPPQLTIGLKPPIQ